MAFETNFQPRSGITLHHGTEITLGTATLTGGGWNTYQVTDFSFSHASAPLEIAPQRTALLGQLENQGVHRPDTQMYEASVTMRGTAKALLACGLNMWSDGITASELKPSSTSGSLKHAASNTSGHTLLFEGGGSDATNSSVLMWGCFLTNLTIKQDIGANAGELTIEATYTTAYKPIESALVATSPTLDTGAPFNILSLSSDNPSIAAQPLFAHSWEISVSRSLERVGCSEYTNHTPFGYVQTSPYEVTGSVVCKRDDSIEDIGASFNSNTAVAFSVTDGTLTVSCPDIMIDNSQPDAGSGYAMQTIPFRAFAASATAVILSIAAS
jgi:hypothetical protein